MKREAESHAAEDKKRRETIDLKNQADNLVYQTEKALREYPWPLVARQYLRLFEWLQSPIDEVMWGSEPAGSDVVVVEEAEAQAHVTVPEAERKRETARTDEVARTG